jgi:hypothetical protein
LDPVFLAIEDSALSEWIRGASMFAFPTIVTLHTLGMGFLAGGSAAIDLRILGVAPGMPLKPMGKFLPVLWIALAVNITTGVLLLIAYPTKALTNPMFYLKLTLIAVALTLLYRIIVEVVRGPQIAGPFPARARMLAAASLISWVAVITAGRLLAYTNRWELVGIPAIN